MAQRGVFGDGGVMQRRTGACDALCTELQNNSDGSCYVDALARAGRRAYQNGVRLPDAVATCLHSFFAQTTRRSISRVENVALRALVLAEIEKVFSLPGRCDSHGTLYSDFILAQIDASYKICPIPGDRRTLPDLLGLLTPEQKRRAFKTYKERLSQYDKDTDFLYAEYAARLFRAKVLVILDHRQPGFREFNRLRPLFTCMMRHTEDVHEVAHSTRAHYTGLDLNAHGARVLAEIEEYVDTWVTLDPDLSYERYMSTERAQLRERFGEQACYVFQFFVTTLLQKKAMRDTGNPSLTLEQQLQGVRFDLAGSRTDFIDAWR